MDKKKNHNSFSTTSTSYNTFKKLKSIFTFSSPTNTFFQLHLPFTPTSCITSVLSETLCWTYHPVYYSSPSTVSHGLFSVKCKMIVHCNSSHMLSHLNMHLRLLYVVLTYQDQKLYNLMDKLLMRFSLPFSSIIVIAPILSTEGS